MTIEMQDLISLGEVLLAMILGGLIGIEREAENKPAGLRTHMLVAGASTLFVILGKIASEQFAALLGPDYVRVDAVRIIQAIVVGISFLGAGTIYQRGKSKDVEGLTTA
ncbi:MAG TPA: MgtC/SapB family protein, partial [Anaerolineales bacterium]|nr:MgtC/SapB family protein [Anaerolineales bacterium]